MDDSEACDGGKTAFSQYPVCTGGLLVRRGQRERMTTTMLISNGPPDNDEKGANKGVYRASAAIFLAIKPKALIVMSVWCLYAFISAVMAVLSLFWHHHGHYALRTADFELISN